MANNGRDRTKFALIALVVVLIGYIAYSEVQRQKLAGEIEKLSRAHARTRGPDEDPYLKNEVKNRVVKGFGELQTCYNDYLASNPSVAEGQVVVDWWITEQGNVEDANIVRSPIEDDGFKNCVKKSIAAWTFPPPPEDRKRYITHKLVFKTKETLARERAELEKLEKQQAK